MSFYWVRDRFKQKHFLVYWEPFKYNMSDYHTKFYSPSHHKKQLPLRLHTETSPQYIPCDASTLQKGCVKPFPTVNRVNIFRGGRYNNQERPNILHGKVLATCVAILGAQPNTIRLINEMLCVPVNRDQIRAKNRAARNIK